MCETLVVWCYSILTSQSLVQYQIISLSLYQMHAAKVKFTMKWLTVRIHFLKCYLCCLSMNAVTYKQFNMQEQLRIITIYQPGWRDFGDRRAHTHKHKYTRGKLNSSCQGMGKFDLFSITTIPALICLPIQRFGNAIYRAARCAIGKNTFQIMHYKNTIRAHRLEKRSNKKTV